MLYQPKRDNQSINQRAATQSVCQCGWSTWLGFQLQSLLTELSHFLRHLRPHQLVCLQYWNNCYSLSMIWQ